MQYYGNNPSYGLGRVEDVHDPLEAGRVRVRILGLHSELLSELPTAHLPWCQVLQPVTSAGMNSVGSSPTGLKYGSMVFGWFLDGDNKQVFLVGGSIAGVENAETQIEDINSETTSTKPVGKTKPTPELGLQTVNPQELIKNFFVTTLKYSLVAAAGITTYVEVRLKLGTRSTTRNALNEKLRTLFDDPKRIDSFCAQYKYKNSVPEATLLYFHSILSASSWPKISTSDKDGYVSLKPCETAHDYAHCASQAMQAAMQTKMEVTPKEVIDRAVSAAPPKQTPKVDTTIAKPSGSDFGSIVTIPQLMKKFTTCTRKDKQGNGLNGLVIHSTASFNNAASGLALVNSIRADHIKNRGWTDIGYHFIIGTEGEIYAGRNINKSGAHAGAPRGKGDQYAGQSWNYQTVGVALMHGLGDPPRKANGEIDKDAVKKLVVNGIGLEDRLITRSNGRMTKAYTVKQIQTLTEFIKTFLTAFPNSQILGHNQVDNKGKLDPYFDVPEFLADRLGRQVVRKI